MGAYGKGDETAEGVIPTTSDRSDRPHPSSAKEGQGGRVKSSYADARCSTGDSCVDEDAAVVVSGRTATCPRLDRQAVRDGDAGSVARQRSSATFDRLMT